MKSLYGMTCIGAHDQIKKRLKDRCAIEDEDELFAASCYATKVNTYRYSKSLTLLVFGFFSNKIAIIVIRWSTKSHQQFVINVGMPAFSHSQPNNFFPSIY
ncbi:hypothetical protein CsSME_00044017 [Camellia sinensis var. sinensis]